MNESTFVFIVDDNPTVLNALIALLNESGHQVKTFSSAEEFLEGYDPSQIGCVLLDVNMKGISGLDLQKIMIERNWTIPLIVMSGEANVSMAVQALEAGALAFLEKPFSGQDLLRRVDAAISYHLALQKKQSKVAEMTRQFVKLTQRETEILTLVCDGRLTKQIAAQLGISSRTVETHRTNIMSKLEVKTLAELVALRVAYNHLSESLKNHQD